METINYKLLNCKQEALRFKNYTFPHYKNILDICDKSNLILIGLISIVEKKKKPIGLIICDINRNNHFKSEILSIFINKN